MHCAEQCYRLTIISDPKLIGISRYSPVKSDGDGIEERDCSYRYFLKDRVQNLDLLRICSVAAYCLNMQESGPK